MFHWNFFIWKFKSSNITTDFDDDNINQVLKLTEDDNDTTMGHLFSKENNINKENSNSNVNEKVNTDIKVYTSNNDQNKNHRYFTIINDQIGNNETMVNKREIIQSKAESISRIWVFCSF